MWDKDSSIFKVDTSIKQTTNNLVQHKIQRRGIAGVIGWRPNPFATTIGTNTKCDPRSNLRTFKSHGKDSEVWKMGATSTELGFILRTRIEVNYGFHLVRPADRLQGRITLVVRQCSVFGGTGVVWCGVLRVIKPLVKRWKRIITYGKLSILTVRLSKIGRNGPEDMAKLF